MKHSLSKVLTVLAIVFVLIAPALGILALLYYHHFHIYHDTFAVQTIPSDSFRGSSNLGVGLLVFLPLGFCLGLSFNDGLRIYRTAILREQIAKLERLWQEGN